MNKKHKGAILIYLATMLTVLLGFTALAIDVGHAYVVRNELQNAADSIALTGALYFYPSGGPPNWSQAQTKAQEAVPLNKADNVALANATIQTGYWNLNSANPTLQSQSITPGLYDSPAIQVTVQKSAGQNGGPVTLFFGQLIGIPTMNVSATATAVSGSPGAVGLNSLFPIAMTKVTYDLFWDVPNNKPKTDPLTGQPYIFTVAPGQGQFTSFTTDSSDVTTLRALMLSGNPVPLRIGDNIWIQTGVKNTLYQSVPVGVDVIIPIVNSVLVHGLQPIVGFGGVYIVAADHGSNPFVQVQLKTSIQTEVGNPGGPNYGVYTPPRLVK